jgi:hypothetical protein
MDIEQEASFYDVANSTLQHEDEDEFPGDLDGA